MKEIKRIFRPIQNLDAEIRTIEHPDKKGGYFIVEVGCVQSLGEQGYIHTELYDSEPTSDEIIADTKEHLREHKAELEASGILTGTEERYLEALNKIKELR